MEDYTAVVLLSEQTKTECFESYKYSTSYSDYSPAGALFVQRYIYIYMINIIFVVSVTFVLKSKSIFWTFYFLFCSIFVGPHQKMENVVHRLV